MSDVAIHVDNLVKVFRTRNGTRAEVPAVNGLSFDVRRGAIFNTAISPGAYGPQLRATAKTVASSTPKEPRRWYPS